MYLAFHYPFIGSPTVDAHPVECPTCPRGKEHGTNDWEDKDITTCNPGDKLKCNICNKEVEILWGLVEPDHLSTWLSSEHCPHRLCKIKYQELKVAKGWQ